MKTPLKQAADAPEKELPALREQLYQQLLRRDKMLYVEGWQLERAYLKLFSLKECTVYELHTRLLMLRRRAELAQNGLSRAAAEAALNAEFAERRQLWLAKMRYRNAVLEDNSSYCLTADRFRQLHLAYAKAVSLLHPDLYPSADENQLAQMQEITLAYCKHNLPLLSLKLELALLSPAPAYNITDAEAERTRLLAALEKNRRVTEHLNNTYPYTLRPLLFDNSACTARLNRLEELIAYLHKQINALPASSKANTADKTAAE